MNQKKKRIIELIEDAKESDIVDFKRQYYHEAKKSDLIKDIISFANALIQGDKYIIFGIDDANREIVGIKEKEIPDISDINQFIRMYCDPYIDIDVEEFEIDNKRVGAIIIKGSNLKKPYVVSKDCSSGGKIDLHAGDIYIRKSANNFRALRNDIEDIYRTRLFVDISPLSKNIKIGIIEIARVKQMFARIPVCLANSTDHSFVFAKATIKWLYSDSNISSSVCYIEEDSMQFKQTPIPIESSAFVLQSKTQIQKVLYTTVSEGFCNVIKSHENACQELKIEMVFHDARDTEHKISFLVDKIIWE